MTSPSRTMMIPLLTLYGFKIDRVMVRDDFEVTPADVA